MAAAAVRDRRHPLSPPRCRVFAGPRSCPSRCLPLASIRKTIPGWEYQFVAALGHLRTAWAALVDVERTTPATRTQQTARQVRNLLRRLRTGRARRPRRPAAGHHGRRVQRRRPWRGPSPGGPCTCHPAGIRQRGLGGPGHLARQEQSGTVEAPACRSPATTTPARPTPNPMRPSPCRTARATAPSASAPRHQVHPLIHGDRGWSRRLGRRAARAARHRAPRHRRAPARRPQGAQDPCGCGTPGPAPPVPRRAVARLPGPLDEETPSVGRGHPGPDRRRGPRPRAGRAGGARLVHGHPKPSCSWPARMPQTCAAPGKPGRQRAAP